MKADLHVHSTASDGTLTPEQLVALALERGVSVLAIADHDSVAGIPAALAASHDSSLTCIPAVELSAVVAGLDVHVLGYFIDHEDADLTTQLVDLREARMNRARTILSTLGEAGFAVTLHDVLELTDGGAIGRSHIARALVARGHAVTVKEAFERFIGRDRPFYVAKDVRTPAEVIATIRAAGGLAVVAHPGVSGLDDHLDQLIADGLGGIEAFHADHAPAQQARYADLAARHGLITTGGTDFHGPDAPNPQLGSQQLPAESIAALLEWGRTRM